MTARLVRRACVVGATFVAVLLRRAVGPRPPASPLRRSRRPGPTSSRASSRRPPHGRGSPRPWPSRSGSPPGSPSSPSNAAPAPTPECTSSSSATTSRTSSTAIRRSRPTAASPSGDLPCSREYRVVVDAYPRSGPQPNFQLFRTSPLRGRTSPRPLPPFSSTVTSDGYRFTLHGRPRLKAISPAFLTVTVERPDGSPARFSPWYGALAHAIFFRQGSLDYFHTHVCSSRTTDARASSAARGSPATRRRLGS